MSPSGADPVLSILNARQLVSQLLRQNKDVRRRELAPLQKVRDNYEKMILSLDPGLETSFEGIKSKNLIDWLISE